MILRGAEESAQASDPSTSTERLGVLAVNYPREVSENIVFPLLLIERPALLDEWSPAARRSLLAAGQLPESMLRAFALDTSRPGYRIAVAENPFLPADLFPLLVRERSNNQLSVALASNPALPEALLRAMAVRKVDQVRAAAAGNPSLPPDEIERLARDDSAEVRAAVASNPSLPLDRLETLSHDESPVVRKATLTSAHLPAARVRALMADLDHPIRARARAHQRGDTYLAQMIATAEDAWHRTPPLPVPITMLTSLAREGPYARWLAASHPATPAEVLERLAGDACMTVVEAVAGNPSTPHATLASLERREALRYALLKNPTTPPALLEEIAAECLRAASELRNRRPLQDIRLWIAYHPHALPERLDQLSLTPDLQLHLQIAHHPSTLPITLARLAASRNPKARAAVALHAACPPEVRARLAADPDARVRRAAADEDSG